MALTVRSILSRSFCGVVALLLLIVATARHGTAGSHAERPNVILIVIDALRADGLGVYGNLHGNSPTLDAIAREGVVFRHAESPAPWTQPSMASLFSGVYPGVHRVLNFQLAINGSYLHKPKVAVFDSSFTTIAEELHARGYATAGFVANPFLLSEYGFAQGFDHYDASFAKNTTPGNVVNDAALAWLRRRDVKKPFFLYLHYMDVHGPYDPSAESMAPFVRELEQLPNKTLLPAQERRRVAIFQRMPPGKRRKVFHPDLAKYLEYWVARYEADIRDLDQHIAGLRAALESMGLWDGAYVIVTADHGEALYEHGFWEHGYSVHESDLHVPLILRWKGALPSGSEVGATVSTIDLKPTLEAQLGLAADPKSQGVSLVPYIQNSASAPPQTAFAEGVKQGPLQRAIFSAGWKLIVTLATGRTELYDIRSDPNELHDLSSAKPGEVQRLTGMLHTQVAANARLAGGREAKRVDLSPEQLERLRVLGYGRH